MVGVVLFCPSFPPREILMRSLRFWIHGAGGGAEESLLHLGVRLGPFGTCKGLQETVLSQHVSSAVPGKSILLKSVSDCGVHRGLCGARARPSVLSAPE